MVLSPVFTGSRLQLAPSGPSHSHSIRRFLKLSPSFAAHPKSALLTPLVAALTKNGRSKSFACRTYEKTLGGAHPPDGLPRMERAAPFASAFTFSLASSYSNSREPHLSRPHLGCYHRHGHHEVLLLLLAAPFRSPRGRRSSILVAPDTQVASPCSRNTGHGSPRGQNASPYA